MKARLSFEALLPKSGRRSRHQVVDAVVTIAAMAWFAAALASLIAELHGIPAPAGMHLV